MEHSDKFMVYVEQNSLIYTYWIRKCYIILMDIVVNEKVFIVENLLKSPTTVTKENYVFSLPN